MKLSTFEQLLNKAEEALTNINRDLRRFEKLLEVIKKYSEPIIKNIHDGKIH